MPDELFVVVNICTLQSYVSGKHQQKRRNTLRSVIPTRLVCALFPNNTRIFHSSNY
jgi:hypothetical protein